MSAWLRRACGLAFVAGCSLTDLSDLSDGGPADVTTDKSSSPDGSVDAAASDGCGHLFCDNFDDHALGGGWDDVAIPANLSLSDVAVSPPNALQAFTAPAPSGNDDAFLVKSFPSAQHIELQADLRTLCDAVGEIDIVAIFAQSFSLTVNSEGSSATGELIYTDADGGAHDLDKPLPPAAFVDGGLPYHRYRLVVDVPTGTYSVFVDGAQVLANNTPLPLLASPFTVQAGALYHSTLVNDCITLVDNVTVDAQ